MQDDGYRRLGSTRSPEKKTKKQLKNNKAPGPDGNVAELYAWLNTEGFECLLEALNENGRNKKLAEYENAANIACLYKTRDHENPENYRPIRCGPLIKTLGGIVRWILNITLRK